MKTFQTVLVVGAVVVVGEHPWKHY